MCPDGKIRIAWDLIYTILLAINILWIPVKVAFGFNRHILYEEDIPVSVKILVGYLPGILFLGEIIINFNTGFFEDVIYFSFYV